MKNPSFDFRLSTFDSLAALPPVSEMMRAAGLEPKKQFGQNFLFDLNLTGKIARAVPNIENSTVVEVGPGPGGLTRALLLDGARKVIAIEKDKTTAPILEQIAAADGRLEIIFADALKFDFARLGKISICSNLPYNVGTELLIRWLHDMENISSMTLMFQREVAERIVAAPGTEHYGRLSVLTSLLADAKILFDVPNTAFVPRPKVQSAVVQIIPKNVGARTHPAKSLISPGPGGNAPIDKIEKLTAKLFGQRRKMIRGILPGALWEQFGLSGTERAEELTPEKFAEIAAANVI
ncbi:MAG: 16S rRNA (adenine(1518)-N(6)/adenine(1519)-N(6))-dimethyltransferase RsmA [Alphaproteobacteria bacterium]|nr:16S rRNA (adenine(1518)-N(6)/adenine(1519)-N(6))-dimethyltransferase RsmA [Alphaproteobacteria bacterium]